MIYDNFDEIGKNNITATSSDFIQTTGTAGMKSIILKVLLGGNVRDVTEFITQRRLLGSYAAMLDLFLNTLDEQIEDSHDYSSYVSSDLINARGAAKVLDLWLLGLTKKGLDNIVRDEANINAYQRTFADSIDDAVEDTETHYGAITGKLKIGEKEVEIDWNKFLLFCIALGSQTLSIRGSAKSMNGKLFEKLMLGTLLSIMGFSFCPEPPDNINEEQKLFWLSNMDEHERETDATLIYKGKAVSIDLGFIGRGNPEITLDKVTRFGRYKEIAGVNHDMSTIIIVDTVGEGSDLFHKATRVGGTVLQMRESDWVLQFANAIQRIFNFSPEILSVETQQIRPYLQRKIRGINIDRFVSPRSNQTEV